MDIWARLMTATAGLMGMAGVATAAAGSHAGGGDLARTAAEFLMIHGAVVFALAGLARTGLQPRVVWLSAASVLVIGTAIFSADLALIAFEQWRPWPAAAPIGGSLMMIGWLAIPVGALVPTRGGGQRGI